MDAIESKVLKVAAEIYETKDVETLKQNIIEDYGKEGLRGYGIFSGGSEPIAEHICTVDVFQIYKGDHAAAEQAEKDGIKLIPWREQPQKGELGWYRYIDTPKNRKQLDEDYKSGKWN